MQATRPQLGSVLDAAAGTTPFEDAMIEYHAPPGGRQGRLKRPSENRPATPASRRGVSPVGPARITRLARAVSE